MGTNKFSLLYNKFPELLIEKNVIKCNEGLYDTVAEMLAAIKIYQDANLGKSNLTPTVFNAIESKYGVLNIDYSGGDEVVWHIVDFTKRISFKTCEVCGKMGELYCSSKWMHWSDKKTLCKDHAVKLFYYIIT
tara:strand:- start:388 stop:786 length:399 start_codon:yes stop_codon:yes gene_type:complete